MLLKMKMFGFQKNCTRCEKNVVNKIVHFKEIYKFSIDYSFVRVIYFLLFIKNVFIKIKNSIFPLKYNILYKDLCHLGHFPDYWKKTNLCYEIF